MLTEPEAAGKVIGEKRLRARQWRLEEARAAVVQLLGAEPNYSLEVHKRTTAARGTDLKRDLAALRQAGLPE